MNVYYLMTMKRGQAKPTLLMSSVATWGNILPLSYLPPKVLDDGATVYMTAFSQPLIRPHDWLFWIERADQPAWKAA